MMMMVTVMKVKCECCSHQPRMAVQEPENLLFNLSLSEGPLLPLHGVHHLPPLLKLEAVVQRGQSGFPSTLFPGPFYHLHLSLSCWETSACKGMSQLRNAGHTHKPPSEDFSCPALNSSVGLDHVVTGKGSLEASKLVCYLCPSCLLLLGQKLFCYRILF